MTCKKKHRQPNLALIEMQLSRYCPTANCK